MIFQSNLGTVILSILIAGCTAQSNPKSRESQPRSSQKAVSTLLPPNLNAVQAGIKVNEPTKTVIEVFDKENSSKRHYDFVGPLDGLTFGMAHWPQMKAKWFFVEKIKTDELAKKAFLQRLDQWFNSLDTNTKYKLEMTSNPRQVIEDTLFNKEFFNPFGEPCRQYNQSQPVTADCAIYARLPWLKSFLSYAFRDRTIVEFQLQLFEQDIVVPVVNALKIVNKQEPSPALVTALASLRSSAPAFVKQFINQIQSGRSVSVGDANFSWDNPSEPIPQKNLEEWRRFVLFLFNCQKNQNQSGRIKERTKVYYERFLRPHWKIVSKNLDCSPNSYQWAP